jgi:hypothetical protein
MDWDDLESLEDDEEFEGDLLDEMEKPIDERLCDAFGVERDDCGDEWIYDY